MVIEFPLTRDDKDVVSSIPMEECVGLIGLLQLMFAEVVGRVQLPADYSEELVLHAKVYRSSKGKPKAYCEISRLRSGRCKPALYRDGGEMVVALGTNINVTEEGGVTTQHGHGVEDIVRYLENLD